MPIRLQTRRAKSQNTRHSADRSCSQAQVSRPSLRIYQGTSFCVVLLLFLFASDLNWSGYVTMGQRDGSQLKVKGHDSGSQKEQEWRALDQRWSSLIEQRSKPDIAKWRALDDDFHNFAKEYDIHLEEHAKRANQDNRPAQDTASDFARCPPRDDVRGYRCNLFLGPKGVCRYVCVPLSQK